MSLFSKKLTTILLFLVSFNAHAKPIVNSDSSQCHKNRGVLVLAHGKSSHVHNGTAPIVSDEDLWETTILKMVGEASRSISVPIEVAFGMWDKENFQEGVNLLANQSVCELVVIPLFISDHSNVIRTQKYQFHLTDENPLPFEPGRITIPATIHHIEFKSALNDHPFLSSIIADRASQLSINPASEDLILVAHGPNDETDDLQWHKDLSAHAERIVTPFFKKHIITLRDDAPDEIRNQRTKELQDLVKQSLANQRKALIVPVLLAPGGIEAGLKERLYGLDYVLSPKMLAPDSHLVEWLIQKSNEPTL